MKKTSSGMCITLPLLAIFLTSWYSKPIYGQEGTQLDCGDASTAGCQNKQKGGTSFSIRRNPDGSTDYYRKPAANGIESGHNIKREIVFKTVIYQAPKDCQHLRAEIEFKDGVATIRFEEGWPLPGPMGAGNNWDLNFGNPGCPLRIFIGAPERREQEPGRVEKK